ncbi:hypothetical protein QO207_11640 [Pseudomonas sp. CAN2814]|uniref:hypothetical protein n=1 Tax=Pseudomonas sp. CAN1 TaxID=3046726 RepID=UPI002648A2AE|nr:hypothetical protein [Pseudomonas sp. CAN1]MDN6857239.1 hypothetical protein [Pseudomonas sp. CAN1]
MSDAIRIKCWSCREGMTLFEHGKADGMCPCCGVEVDLAGYLEEAIQQNLQLGAEVEALRNQASTYTDLREELRQAQKEAGLYREIQNAARDLPGAWSIQLCVEQGAGWIDLFDDDGCKVDFATSSEGLATTVKDAMEHAIDTAKAGAQ